MDDETDQSGERPKYRDKLTERLAKGERVKQFQGFKEQAERRLDLLEAAITVNDLKRLPSNRFETLGATVKDNTASALTSSGGFALNGRKLPTARSTLRLWTTTREQRP